MIARSKLSLNTIITNYFDLLTNKQFMCATFASGLLSLPCVVWIAVSPIMLVKEAHCSLLEYAVWQLPLFGASILGNIVLRKISYESALKRMIVLGSSLAVVSLVVMWCTVTLFGPHFINLMPGLIVYFFALGITSAPLNRFILYVTSVSKGTTSALLSLMIMSILAGGVEWFNHLYQNHSNQLFALYCVGIAMIYSLLLVIVFYSTESLVVDDTANELTNVNLS